ncbi:MAG: DUF362 domain-containing protein [Candidatus Latescibacter sp.]|nr:DUF362 domain-containing protein [Candidatus Latescibacter sp.]
MFDRREFIKTAAAAGSLGLVQPIQALALRNQTSAGFFRVHPFVDSNPEAVFIMKTNVDVKTNHDAVKSAGKALATSVLVPSDSGVPLTNLFPIKPNITYVTWTGPPAQDAEYRMGVITDPWFVEGIIERYKSLGVAGNQITVLDVWNDDTNRKLNGYADMTQRQGVNMNPGITTLAALGSNLITWVDAPNGVYFRKIPYIYPVNAPNSWLLDVSKFKAHGMGITLCCKNIQGTIAKSYQEHCSRYDAKMSIDFANANPNWSPDIGANYTRHKTAGIPRWDKPGTSGGIWMETWASRCLDNNSVTKSGLHVIEGVYGRDGDGFLNGPNKGTKLASGEAWDYMSNIIIFGKNQFNVDIIGHWMAGQEPGNFGLFHIAKERGLTNRLNPANIPVYEWKADGTATLTPLKNFTRTPLLTYYLQKDYSGGTEAKYHLVNEPFTYAPETTVVEEIDRPQAFLLHQNRPNPFNPNTSIQYDLPKAGNARLEVFNEQGQLVEVLADGYTQAGRHMAVWNTQNRASGTYFYRFLYGGYSETKKMLLLK